VYGWSDAQRRCRDVSIPYMCAAAVCLSACLLVSLSGSQFVSRWPVDSVGWLEVIARPGRHQEGRCRQIDERGGGHVGVDRQMRWR